MKTFISLVVAGLIVMPAFSQEDTIRDNSEIIKVSDEPGKASVIVKGKEVMAVDENKDTTRIRIGKKGILVTQDKEGKKIIVKDLDEQEKEENEDWEKHETPGAHENKEAEKQKSKKAPSFKGHWSGFQLGLNNYLNSNNSMSLDNSMSFMDLNTDRSWTYGLNLFQHDFGLGTNKVGIVTGVGIEWSNYNFDMDLSIRRDSIGVIQPYDLSYLGSIQKNKLSTTYLNVPLILEFQIPAGKKRVYFSGGLLGGIKLGSHTKIVYKENGDKKKIKDKDDYNLNSLRYGITARAGYKGLNLFATYYLTPLFETNKGPELYPFYIGLTLIDF
jgi:hypothetical protein